MGEVEIDYEIGGDFFQKIADVEWILFCFLSPMLLSFRSGAQLFALYLHIVARIQDQFAGLFSITLCFHLHCDFLDSCSSARYRNSYFHQQYLNDSILTNASDLYFIDQKSAANEIVSIEIASSISFYY